MDKFHDLVTRLRLTLGIPVLGGEKYNKEDLFNVLSTADKKGQEIFLLKVEANELLHGDAYEAGSGRGRV